MKGCRNWITGRKGSSQVIGKRIRKRPEKVMLAAIQRIVPGMSIAGLGIGRGLRSGRCLAHGSVGGGQVPGIFPGGVVVHAVYAAVKLGRNTL